MVSASPLKAGEIALYLDDKGQLRPCEDGESWRRFQRLKIGETYIFEFRRERNYKFLKKYFSLLNVGFQNQEKFTDFEWFRTYTLIGIGHCETKIDPFTGSVHCEAKSISFAKCKEKEFEEIFKKTVTFFVERFGYDHNFVQTVMGYL